MSQPRIRPANVFPDRDFPLALHWVTDHRDTKVHSHGFYELVVVLEGHGRHLAGEESYPIEAGDVFLLRGDMVHGYADMEHMTLVNILFDPKRLQLPMDYLEDLSGYHALFRVEPRLREHSRFRNRLHLTEEELAEEVGMVARLKEELARRRPGYRFQACVHLMGLIGFLSRCYSHNTPRTERPFLLMGDALSYIEQHFREPIGIRDLTRIAHMSESTLTRTFRRVLGRSPIEHVIRVRVLRAADLLQRGEVRVTEAAFQCGFSDSNYFSRQFRKVMGVSPRQFRSRHVPPSHP
jgi:AraC family L-rhamnose operon transcriptional activator RhaR/AraC family L-rhamnose operon regulatory protein RhaS